jgi:hypothetical protein
MSNEGLREITLQLDERNLAHVLSGMALVALISRIPDARPSESTCWWGEQDFLLKTATGEATLFDAADKFLRSIRWLSGVGGKKLTGKEQGIFVADGEFGSNPFLSLAEDGESSSPFKTFSARQEPAKDLLDKQRKSLQPPYLTTSWLSQIAYGISSWGFDSRVGSHAYDLGFSSFDDGSGECDPIYPAIELLSIAAASFFTCLQGWQKDEGTVEYTIWPQPLSVALAQYAVAGRLDELPSRRYGVTTRGGAYGKGGAFRFFPEAVPDDNQPRKKYERRTKSKRR